MNERLIAQPVEQPAPLVYTVAEVARMLQLSESTVYRRIDDGEIPARHYGRSVRVPRWWVDDELGRAA